MKDLNLITFFKASFEIKANQDEVDIPWEIVCSIRTWLTDKYKEGSRYNPYEKALISSSNQEWTNFKNGSTLSSLEENVNQTIVYCRSQAFQIERTNTIYWACLITESPKPERDVAQRQWLTSIVYRGTISEGHFDLVTSYRDRGGFIGHYEKEPEDITVPRPIRLLLSRRKLSCHSAGIPMSASPRELKIGEGKKFRSLVFNPVRDLPLIYISSRKQEGRETDIGELLLSPEEVNNSVMGNAFVYFSRSLEFSEEAEYLLGKRYECKGGNAIVYFPMAENENEDNKLRFRIISAQDIEEKYGVKDGKKEILTILRKAFAQNSDFYKHILDYDTCSLMRSRENQQSKISEKEDDLQKLRARIAEMKNATEDDKKKLFDLADEEGKKYDRLSSEYSALFNDYEKQEKEIEELKIKLYTSEQQVDQLKKKNAGALDENFKLLLQNLQNLPNNCQDIAKVIKAMFPNRIAFTEKGEESLKECVTEPALLWKLLFGMATTFFDLLHKNPVNAAKDFTHLLGGGFEYGRGEGSMTRRDSVLMRQYKDIYQGIEIDIETHFKKGNKDSDSRSLRVYYAWVQEKDIIVVGHCGKHLENYTTQKMH